MPSDQPYAWDKSAPCGAQPRSSETAATTEKQQISRPSWSGREASACGQYRPRRARPGEPPGARSSPDTGARATACRMARFLMQGRRVWERRSFARSVIAAIAALLLDAEDGDRWPPQRLSNSHARRGGLLSRPAARVFRARDPPLRRGVLLPRRPARITVRAGARTARPRSGLRSEPARRSRGPSHPG